jgi:hypothetical protein
MSARPGGMRYIPGKGNLLVISPHSPVINGVFENDARTGIVTEHIQQALDCHAIINDLFFKPKGPIKKASKTIFSIFTGSTTPEKFPATAAATPNASTSGSTSWAMDSTGSNPCTWS